ncbi:hypothetical protein ACIBO9_30575 [Streptomyces prunicolor]|uniref:hypothetical protein n=1 Tax=Streptomyces prunicolor TaxID=67348 RepID=UPI0037CD5379
MPPALNLRLPCLQRPDLSLRGWPDLPNLPNRPNLGLPCLYSRPDRPDRPDLSLTLADLRMSLPCLSLRYLSSRGLPDLSLRLPYLCLRSPRLPCLRLRPHLRDLSPHYLPSQPELSLPLLCLIQRGLPCLPFLRYLSRLHRISATQWRPPCLNLPTLNLPYPTQPNRHLPRLSFPELRLPCPQLPYLNLSYLNPPAPRLICPRLRPTLLGGTKPLSHRPSHLPRAKPGHH